MAIIEYVGDLEDIYLAEKRLEDHRAGRADSISLEDMMKQHGLAN
jgi:RHH-type rel operon transcriptional repressor/antitoxin RelB